MAAANRFPFPISVGKEHASSHLIQLTGSNLLCHANSNHVQLFDHVLRYSVHVSLYLLLLLIIFILFKLHTRLREEHEIK